MKKIVFAILVSLALAASVAETRTVSNVDELYAALAELSNGPSMNYISLNAGTYDVSGRTHPGPGSAHLGATNVVFMGATGNREDVLVFGDMTRPVFGLYSGGVRHLTVSNGTLGVRASGSGSQMTNICVTCCSNTTEIGGAGYQGTWNACLIVGNYSKHGGGLNICTAQNCIISNNTAINGGGTYRGTMIGCTIVDNRAANGGGMYEGTARGGRIELNDADYTGGGAYGAVISNKCVIYGNSLARFNKEGTTSRYGAGVRSGSVYDSMIIGNAVLPCDKDANKQGGGAYGANLYDCLIANNYSASLSSAINGGKAVRCVISNNVATSAQGYPIRQLSTGKGMEDCTVYNEFCNAVNFANRCKFIGFTGKWTLTAEDNPHAPGTYSVSTTSLNLLYAGNHLTNCLVANNTAGRLFLAGSNCDAVNCTFVDNKIDYFDSDYVDNNLKIENCIFAGNKKRDGSELTSYFEGRLANHTNVTLNCCAFDKPIYSAAANKAPAFQSNIYQFSDMKFNSKNAEHPYSLKRSSPARGKGEVQDWMADATDLRHDPAFPRLRDGLVDLGCYECWLDPVGFKYCIQ